MSTVHTSGLIKFHVNGDANSYALLDQDGAWLMSLLHNGHHVSERQQANLRRLAACWNALEGVSTENIEQFTACMDEQRQFADSAAEVGSLYDQRNAELAAARALLAEVNDTQMLHGDLDERITAFLKGGAA